MQADNNIWHNVFFPLDSECFNLWFNSAHVCKCCSIPKSGQSSNSDEIKIGTPFASGTSTQAILYIDSLNIYDEFIYYEERCDNDVICGPGEETLEGYSCTQCLPGKFKAIKENYMCQRCQAGKYSSGLGALSCQNCDIDKISNLSSRPTPWNKNANTFDVTFMWFLNTFECYWEVTKSSIFGLMRQLGDTVITDQDYKKM